MTNQAAGLKCTSQCHHNLKVILGDRNKGKSSSKVHQAAEDYLVTFNHSITQAMARTMQDLSEDVFINVALAHTGS